MLRDGAVGRWATVVLRRDLRCVHVALIEGAQIFSGGGVKDTTWQANRGSFARRASRRVRTVDVDVADELSRRGAWARCNQIIGASMPACETSRGAHTAGLCNSGVSSKQVPAP